MKRDHTLGSQLSFDALLHFLVVDVLNLTLIFFIKLCRCQRRVAANQLERVGIQGNVIVKASVGFP